MSEIVWRKHRSTTSSGRCLGCNRNGNKHDVNENFQYFPNDMTYRCAGSQKFNSFREEKMLQNNFFSEGVVVGNNSNTEINWINPNFFHGFILKTMLYESDHLICTAISLTKQNQLFQQCIKV